MEYTIRDKGIHKIYELVGSLDIYSASKMKKEINAVLDEDDIDSLVLDMSKVTHMDSSGIALIANLQKKMKTAGSKFALLNVTNDIMAVLRLSSLDNFFTIYNSETDLK
ncbi:MAG: STAS domain-containing protein [Leptospiraceae bacterium]|nr:STAS domain-containing protein [Leptospiraceae bacterium]MCP5512473.1 STAS domain-containing protein [Leptospiraceae bacterium]